MELVMAGIQTLLPTYRSYGTEYGWNFYFRIYQHIITTERNMDRFFIFISTNISLQWALICGHETFLLLPTYRSSGTENGWDFYINVYPHIAPMERKAKKALFKTSIK